MGMMTLIDEGEGRERERGGGDHGKCVWREVEGMKRKGNGVVEAEGEWLHWMSKNYRTGGRQRGRVGLQLLRRGRTGWKEEEEEENG